MNAIISTQRQAAADGDAAVDFLLGWTERWKPDWFVNVCTIPAIHTANSRGVIGRSHSIKTLAQNRGQLAAFIEERNRSGDGLYFSPNPLSRAVTTKACKTDLAAIVALAVDLDPHTEGGDHNERRVHLLLHVEKLIEDSDPVVAGMISSGNGVGLFHLLAQPLPLQDMEIAEKVCAMLHARSAGFAKIDGTHNVDRLMRLPNTLNWPSTRKLAQGYPKAPSLAEAIYLPMTPMSAEEWADLIQRTPVRTKAPRSASSPSGPDVVAVPGSAADVFAEVRAAWGMVSAKRKLADLPDDVRRRFAVSLSDFPILRKRWDGDSDGLNDTSRSGMSMALIAGLRRTGMSVTDTACIAYVHPYGDLNDAKKFPDANKAARSFARAWDHAGGNDHQTHGEMRSAVQLSTEAKPHWSFTPARADIVTSPPPPREWLYGTFLMRGHTTFLASPGGVGKTSLLVVMALAMATGRPLLAPDIGRHDGRSHRPHRRFKAAIVNLEDPIEELERRVAATARHYRIGFEEFADRLFLDSGRVKPLVVAVRTSRNTVEAAPNVEALIRALQQEKIDVLIVDPMVHSHEGDENDNGHMGFVMSLWNKIAAEAGCAVVLVHHFRKGGSAGDAEAIRGASALQGAARVMLTVRTMTKEEAEGLGLGDVERLSHFRFDSAKANMSPASMTEWFKLVSVPLGNGTSEYPGGDTVQTVERWEPSGEFRDLSPEVVAAVCREIESADPPLTTAAQSPRWLGKRLIELGGVSREAAARSVKAWVDAGFIQTAPFKNKDGNSRVGVSLGKPIEEILARMEQRR